MTIANAFTQDYNKIVKQLDSEIMLSPAISLEKERLLAVRNGKVDFPMVSGLGLWDTGATISVIPLQAVKKLDLKPIGKIKVIGVNSETLNDIYRVHVYLPNKVVIPNLSVTVGQIEDYMLIGMDIIHMGDFAITNKDNRTMFSFRIPSKVRLDFVEQSNKDK